MSDNLRACWLNCYAPDDKRILRDKELIAIDAMEDSIAPLDEQTIQIRQVITRFEACYHEADKEADYIFKSIALASPLLEQWQGEARGFYIDHRWHYILGEIPQNT